MSNALQHLGEDATGRLVTVVRLCVALLGLSAITLAISVTGMALFRGNQGSQTALLLWGALGLFVAGMTLLMLSAYYKVKSNPFLIDAVLREASKRPGTSTDDIVKLITVLEAHSGPAAFFNRLNFTGASLAMVSAAVFVMLLGLLAVARHWVEDYAIFGDVAKLLFGAFVGSFAGRSTPRRPVRAGESEEH
jgi:hypothetical protein